MKQFETENTNLKQQLDATKQTTLQLRTYKLDSEIVEVASKLNAYNPKQIARLLKADFVYDENLDKFYFPVYDSKGKMTDELTVEERVTKFLSDKENENLVKSTVNTSSMHTKQTTTTPSSKTYTPSGKYDPKDPKIQRGAEERGLEVDEYIKILEMRDNRMKQIKDSRK